MKHLMYNLSKIKLKYNSHASICCGNHPTCNLETRNAENCNHSAEHGSQYVTKHLHTKAVQPLIHRQQLFATTTTCLPKWWDDVPRFQRSCSQHNHCKLHYKQSCPDNVRHGPSTSTPKQHRNIGLRQSSSGTSSTKEVGGMNKVLFAIVKWIASCTSRAHGYGHNTTQCHRYRKTFLVAKHGKSYHRLVN
jgi:hypothetical protein